MAKKKYTKKPVKRRKKRTSRKKKESALILFISSLRNMTLGAAVITIVFIGILFFFEYRDTFRSQKKKQAWQEQQITTPKEKKVPEKQDQKDSEPLEKQKTKRPATSFSLSYPTNAELPRLQMERAEQVICYEGFTVSYNSNYKIANWVAWELTKEEAESREVERSNKFTPDPILKGATALNEDYTRTGYDRGHLAPAGDMKWSHKAMQESFYFSNICPQVPALNRGLWKTLEEQSRIWAIKHGSLMIVTGPVIEEDLKRLGKNRVAIPKRFYKVISTISDNKYQGIGFIMDNKDNKNILLKSVAIPIDSVEKITGIDFFHILPDDSECQMESTIEWECWPFGF